MKNSTLNKIALVAVVGVTISVVLSHKKPEPDRLTPPVASAAPIIPVAVKGDSKCEADRGERDSQSPTFDVASCGYCGDGVCQKEFETPVTCFADCHCGNGQIDTNQPVARFEVINVNGKEVYALHPDPDHPVPSITESCTQNTPNYCAVDCTNK